MSVQLVQAITGLILGLAIALFHRPVADFILERERALDMMFRSRGFTLLSPPPTRAAAHDLYFVVGILLALLEVGRLWFTLR